MSSSFTTSSTSPPHYTLQCRACNKPITFDDGRTSQRTGKKIPLDVQTNERHDCPARKAAEYPTVRYSSPSPSSPQEQIQKQRLYHQCNKGCRNEIYFDANNKSQSGKWIPLSKDTGLPHQCQQQY
jgi:hypothetical protein